MRTYENLCRFYENNSFYGIVLRREEDIMKECNVLHTGKRYVIWENIRHFQKNFYV